MLMDELRKIIEKKHIEDVLFLEKQLRKFEALTEKRMQLIRTISHRNPSSIRELADMAHRDVKNVFEDLHTLDEVGIIKFVKHGRKKRPMLRRKIILISLE